MADAAVTLTGWVHLDAQRWALTQMARTDISPLAKLVLFAMASHVRDDRYEIWPSQDRIAKLVGATRQGVRLAIDGLDRVGLIDVTKADGLRTPHTYRLRCEDPLHRCLVGVDSDVNGVDTKELVQESNTSTSTRQAKQQTLDDTTEAILGFPIDGPGGPVWPLRQALVDELSQDFPNLDVVSECRSALAWVKADAVRRKKAVGMRRFLTGWLTRSSRPQPVLAPHHGRWAPTPAQALQRRIDSSGSVDLRGLVDWGTEGGES